MVNSFLCINKTIKFSNIDGPGNRYVIFTQGCNIQCVYCHNFETISYCNNCGVCVSHCEHSALIFKNSNIVYREQNCVNCNTCIYICPNSSSPKYYNCSIETLLQDIKKYSVFLRGVTVSGGECTLQHGEVANLFNKLHKETNLSCFIDTNGYFDFKEIQDLISATDKFMIDIKSVGQTSKVINTFETTRNLENLKKLLDLSKVHEVRTVITNDFSYFDNVVNVVARIIKNYDVCYKLIKMNLKGIKSGKESLSHLVPTSGEMEYHSNTVRSYGVKHVEVL